MASQGSANQWNSALYHCITVAPFINTVKILLFQQIQHITVSPYVCYLFEVQKLSTFDVACSNKLNINAVLIVAFLNWAALIQKKKL